MTPSILDRVRRQIALLSSPADTEWRRGYEAAVADALGVIDNFAELEELESKRQAIMRKGRTT